VNISGGALGRHPRSELTKLAFGVSRMGLACRWRGSRRWSATYNQLAENGTSSPCGLGKKGVLVNCSKAGHGNWTEPWLAAPQAETTHTVRNAAGAIRQRGHAFDGVRAGAGGPTRAHTHFRQPTSAVPDSSLLSMTQDTYATFLECGSAPGVRDPSGKVELPSVGRRPGNCARSTV
jgi:hypothetical protein